MVHEQMIDRLCHKKVSKGWTLHTTGTFFSKKCVADVVRNRLNLKIKFICFRRILDDIKKHFA